MMRKNKIYALIAIAVAILCIFAVVYIGSVKSGPKIDPEKYYPVISVIDGDTFKVKIGRKIATVRLLGIDTPETVHPRKEAECYGREASAAVKQILNGRSVRLKLSAGREVKDRYGRYLAYAYIDDGMSVNEMLLFRGLAREYTYGTTPYSLQAVFRSTERTASLQNIGLWEACGE